MNQNRNNNRRRGRGNNRGGSGGGNQSNRIDSRARGNAPQMLEKYKKLAHDAAMNDDRVQTEYYLQFADHYFRVVADMKSQKDDARSRRDGERDQSDDGEDSDDRDDAQDNRGQDTRGQEARGQESRGQESRGQSRGGQSGTRSRRSRDDDAGEDMPGGHQFQKGMEGDEADGENPFSPGARPKRNTRRKKADDDADNAARGADRNADDAGDAGSESFGLSADFLPPSISKGGDEAAEKKAPRARRPRVRKDSDEETLEARG